MILTNLLDPDEALALLSDVTDCVWDALESGLAKAREYFDAEGTDFDPFLAAHLARYHAKLHLESNQQHAEYERVDLSNSGLRILVNRGDWRIDLRIRKSDDGRLPVPQSDSMRLFYHQPVMLGFYPDQPAAYQTICLVALWEAPKSYTHVTAINLSCPSESGNYRGEVKEHWNVSVPYPVTSIASDGGDPGEEPAADLDIDTLREEMTGTDDEGGE